MILLPDEDEPPVGAQVNAVIGEALRQSVADVEPSADFEGRLAAALDAAERAAGGNGQAAGTELPGAPSEAGPGTEMVEAAS
jgi:hypothetical protein